MQAVPVWEHVPAHEPSRITEQINLLGVTDMVTGSNAVPLELAQGDDLAQRRGVQQPA